MKLIFSSISRSVQPVVGSNIIPTFVLLAALSLLPGARAQITMNFVYDGTNTTLNWNLAAGSFASLAVAGTGSLGAGLFQVYRGGLTAIGGGTGRILVNPGYTNTAWSSQINATSHSGNEILFYDNSSSIFVPLGFDLNTGTLSGQEIWSNKSLIDLGFASNNSNYGSFAAMGTTVNWATTNSAVPEPSSYTALLGLGTIGFVLLRRWRVKRKRG